MKKILEFLFLSVVVAISSSCNVDEEITVALPPKIILDSETGVYTTKQGREIVIAPSYESAEGAYYRWTMEGRLLGTGASLSFMREECGEYYVTLTITTDGGSDSEEIRVDVVALERPMVSISGSKKQTIAIGTEVALHAMVRDSSLPTTLVWTINGEQVCEEPEYTFKAEAAGSYAITATATNEDGTHSDTIEIEVVRAEDMPLVWEFDREAYHTATGRKLQIKPSSVSDLEDIVYTWQIGDETAQRGEASFVFTADTEGQYTITATATTEESGTQISLTHKFVVTVYEAGAFYRAASSMSDATWNSVLEYTPAPGQFINELKTGGFDGSQTTMESAIAYAEKRLSAKNWVSLGGFGGYIVVGFDHSIDNSGDYDLGVIGNAFDGSSEPGIVWVMQDENGNGLPDDTWYELQGSETGKAETIQNYAVTYYRPTGTQMSVWWSDNLGNSGSIDYLAQFHTQDYYYPLWIEEDSYTLTGTLLEARNYDKSGDGSYWVQPHYDWGYTDNFSPTDFSSSDKANLFKISNAIDCECEPIHLDYIDFVKVQVGVNAKSGWLGELSTEVCGFYDYNLKR
jgi:PKD repeat protein